MNRSRGLVRSAGLLLVLVAVAPAAAADDPPPPPPPPAPSAPAADGTLPAQPAEPVLRLTREDAIRYGMARNLELLAGSFDPAVAAASIDAAWGSFDTLLTAGFTGAHAETPSNSTFTGTGVIQENSLAFDATASRKFANGGTLALIFHSDRLFTTSPVAGVNPRWSKSTAVEWSQPLLRGAGGQALADVRRAQSGLVVAEQGYVALADSIVLKVEEAYWNLAFLAEQVEARSKSEDVAKGLLDLTQARLDAKVATPIDLAEARAGLEGRRGDRLVAEGLRGAAEDALKALILPFAAGEGTGPRIVTADDPRAVPPSERMPDADEARSLAVALRRRPDLLAAEADLDVKAIDVCTAKDGLMPQLDLVARLSTGGLDSGFGSALDEMASGQAVSGSVGLTFSMYLGRRSAFANLRIAEWVRSQTEVRKRDLENRIVAEVRSALRDFSTARARMAAAAAEIASANESLTGERVKERNGESTPFRVLQHEEVVTQAVTSEGRAAADVRIALARLWRAMGVLAETRGATAPPSPR